MSRRIEYIKAKQLEEARKAGNAPAEVDEDGKDINPHIPQYISSVPFYYNTNQPTLRHQRVLIQKTKHVPLDTGIKRGLKIQAATNYRKGACENCGAMTHQKRDCLERPRKLGAKFTNKDIAPDEVLLPEIDHNFESKRDRWADIDPELYKMNILEYEKVEEAKKKLKEEKLKQESQSNTVPSTSNQAIKDDLDSDESDDEDKYAEKADMPGTKVDSKNRLKPKNLRIREDPVKYLLSDAHYDPKTRAMREDPTRNINSGHTSNICENFIRQTGQVIDVKQAQVFAWQAASKGIEVHLQALPTKTEKVQEVLEQEKQRYNKTMDLYLEKRYGYQAKKDN